MKARFRFALLAAVLLPGTALVGAGQPSDTSTPHPRMTEGRAISREFAGELRGALERAIAEKGPVAAIEVCRGEAPRIAARLSGQYGATVSRTALKVRNPGNAPQPWQRAGLESFQRRLAEGANADSLEHFELQPNGGARYLKAIVTAPSCALCHGESLSPEIQDALQERYPQDQATGFKPGDLRGAFSIEWLGEKDAAI
jgi:hypothetical protein